MNDVTKIIRKDLLDFTAYRATPNRAKLGTVWLNANESPYLKTYQMKDLSLNRYPPRKPESLLDELAIHYKVTPENLLLSRGSDEAIDLLIRLCCEAGKDQILVCPPTFHMYQIYAKLQNAGVISVPLSADNHFKFPLNEILNQLSPTLKLIFICNPNNPTGNLVASEDIITLCNAVKEQALVIVDEAYIEFANATSMSAYLPKLNNLVILRTLSKAFGLAGARCGVTIASSELIQWLYKICAPYPLPTPTITAVQIALNQENQLKTQEQIAHILAIRKELTTLLMQSPLIKFVWPSETNFLLVQTVDSTKFIKHCLNHGIILRDYSNEPGLENCVRITIGDHDEVKHLLTALSI